MGDIGGDTGERRGDALGPLGRGMARLFPAALVVGVAAIVVLLAGPAHAASPQGDQALSLANGERTSRDLAPLSADARLAQVAQRHAEAMAAAGALFHNDALGMQIAGWEALGENVAASANVVAGHRAFMASPPHRANILMRGFTAAGVGVARRGNTLYIVEVFVQYPSAATDTISKAPRPTRRTSAASPPHLAANTRHEPVAPGRRTSPRREIPSAAPAPGPSPRSVDMILALLDPPGSRSSGTDADGANPGSIAAGFVRRSEGGGWSATQAGQAIVLAIPPAPSAEPAGDAGSVLDAGETASAHEAVRSRGPPRG